MLSNIAKRFFSIYQDQKFCAKMYGLTNSNILRNLYPPQLYEISIKNRYPVDPHTMQTKVSDLGAMVAFSGLKTGRSPKDKRIVKDDETKDKVWWEGNIPIEPSSHNHLLERAISYMNTRPRLFCVDAYAGHDPNTRLRIRIFCCRSYHALFMRNMLIVPTEEELKNDFSGEVDYVIFNSGEYPSSPNIPGIEGSTAVSLNFSDKNMVILGTQYAGEMKKGVFSVMNYLMPLKGILSMHASANEGPNGDISIFFGLSGTGKTTLSVNPDRKLLGDDEHCWSDDTISNIEGGCYAKCINLSRETEPEIYDALRFGAVIENATFCDERANKVDFDDASITENTRAAYPLTHIPNAKIPAIGGHPKNIFFLTCDAYGVLPPVSLLNHQQAMYHYISGYTAKVAGTEQGVSEPIRTFSACFGEAFLPLHPAVYAELLADKMQKYNTKCWLINTGWSGGSFGIGKRMSLKITRRIIDAIHKDELEGVPTEKFDVFDLEVPTHIEGIPNEILMPINTWENKEDYQKTLQTLAKAFNDNFLKYEKDCSDEIKNAKPKI